MLCFECQAIIIYTENRKSYLFQRVNQQAGLPMHATAWYKLTTTINKKKQVKMA